MAAATPSSSSLKRPLQTSDSSQRKRHATEPSSSILTEQLRRTYESELTALQVALRDAQAATRDAQSELIDSQSLISALERERLALLERVEEKHEVLREQVKAEWLSEKTSMENTVTQSESSVSQAQAEAEEAQFGMREAQHLQKLAQGEAQAAKDEAQELQSQVLQLQDELRQAREAPAATRPPDRPASETSHTGINITLQRELSSTLSTLKSLESQNKQLSREVARLQAHVEHTTLLRERLASAQVQTSSIPALQSRLARAEMRASVLEQSAQVWQVYLQAEQASKAPADLCRALAKVSSQNEILHRRLEMAKETHSGLNGLVATLEGRVDELEGAADASKSKQEELRKSVRSLQRSEQLLQTERSFLLAQLDNYALERKLEPDGVNMESQRLVDDMAAALQDLKAQLQVANDQLSAQSAAAAGDDENAPMREEVRQRYADLMALNSTLETELAETHTTLHLAEKDVESLSAQIDKLMHLHGSGLFDPSTTKVLSLIDNPASQDLSIRKQDLQLLEKENKALLTRLDALGGAEQGEGIPRETLEVLQAQLDKSKKQLEQEQLTASRLRQAFKQRASEMREAVASLLGYKLDMKDGGLIRLSSIFATHRQLLFAPVAAGSKDFKLVGDGDGLDAAEQQSFAFWVGDRKCIPAWLANAFIEHYDSATRGGKFASRTYAE